MLFWSIGPVTSSDLPKSVIIVISLLNLSGRPMRLFTRLSVHIVILVTIVGCGTASVVRNGDDVVARGQQAWMGDWHAVWQVEWQGSPIRGPLVAEIWHAVDGRMRIAKRRSGKYVTSPIVFVQGLLWGKGRRMIWVGMGAYVATAFWLRSVRIFPIRDNPRPPPGRNPLARGSREIGEHSRRRSDASVR